MNSINRFLVAAAFVAVAPLASAQINLALSSAGTWSGLDINDNWSQTEAVWAGGSITAPLPMLTTMSLQSANAGSTAVITYSDGVGDSLVVDGTITGFVFDASTNFYSTDGNWLYGGGTGAYAGRGGSGTFAISQWNFAPFPSYSGTVLVGQLTPEPSTYAVLGLGALGLLIRRRKK